MSTITVEERPDRQMKYDIQRKQKQNVELTLEVVDAWHECMKNSNIVRTTLVSAAIGYGVCRITPFRAYAGYTAIVTGMLGMLVDRVQIAKLCLAKVASMPDSTLRDRLIQGYGNRERQSQQYRDSQYQGFQPVDAESEVQSSAEPSMGIMFDNYPPMDTYDTYSSISDSSDFHISEDKDLIKPIKPINPQKGVSYDELRQKNREEFYKQNKLRYALGPSKESPVKATEQIPTTHNPSPMPQEKTKYDDVWN